MWWMKLRWRKIRSLSQASIWSRVKNRLHLKKRLLFPIKEISINDHINNYTKLLADLIILDVVMRMKTKRWYCWVLFLMRDMRPLCLPWSMGGYPLAIVRWPLFLWSLNWGEKKRSVLPVAHQQRYWPQVDVVQTEEEEISRNPVESAWLVITN